MKLITRNSIGFAVITAFFSHIFFMYLYHFLNTAQYKNIPWLSGIFALSMLFNGFLWGYFDKQKQYRYDLGFLYHFISYITVNLVATYTVLIYPEKPIDYVLNVLLQWIIWLISLAIHYLIIRKKLKGMDADEVFI